jgi:hypothetical protein
MLHPLHFVKLMPRTQDAEPTELLESEGPMLREQNAAGGVPTAAKAAV